jgi:ketosteroid isomerase-like protein
MNAVQREIAELEDRLRIAEMGPDPKFFEDTMADDVVMIDERGEPDLAKSKVVEAHRPESGTKFTRVEMADLVIHDYANSAVVTCTGTYESPESTVRLKFMRVWARTNDRWQIVAVSVARA